PLAGGVVEHAAQRVVDLLAAGQGPLEVHTTDDVTQRGDGQLLDAMDVVGDLVGRGLGVVHLVVDDRVDGHDQVVLGDDRLRGEGDHLLAQVDHRQHAVDEGHDDRQPGVEG